MQLLGVDRQKNGQRLYRKTTFRLKKKRKKRTKKKKNQNNYEIPRGGHLRVVVFQSCVAQERQTTRVIDICNELGHTGCRHCPDCTGGGVANVEQVNTLLSNPSL